MALRPDHVGKIGFGTAALLAGLMACVGEGRAEVRVSEPQPGLLVVEAHDATIDEVLAEIGKSQKVQFNSAGPLAGSISGTYRGELSRVLFRLLDGYDVVIRSSRGVLHVRVFNQGGMARVAAPAAGFAVPLHPAVSSNVDADDAKAQAVAAPPPYTAGAPRPPVVASGPARTPSHPRVSSNVDLDEERSVGGN